MSLLNIWKVIQIKIAFAGDWHGNTKYAIRAVEYAVDNDAELIIHVGDFGFNFEQSFIRPLDIALNHAMIELIFVQGNHDNPYILNAAPKGDLGLVSLSNHILRCPRFYSSKA